MVDPPTPLLNFYVGTPTPSEKNCGIDWRGLSVPSKPVPGTCQISCTYNIIMHDFIYFRAL